MTGAESPRDGYSTIAASSIGEFDSETESHLRRNQDPSRRLPNTTLQSLAAVTTLSATTSLPNFASTRATVLLGVDGMVSPRNEHAIESSLAKLPGVKASASFASRSLRVEF